ncbi:hypothetical protein [Shewanella frigidimarina]|uniref:hypothetical protein n=1 Tax=Shewanella frigidimarina TaxID=56812 RepID=UPI003D78E1D6
MNSLQPIDKSQLISDNTEDNVPFSKNRANLPRIAAKAHSFVRVNNRQSGDFFIIAEDNLNHFIDLVCEQKQSTRTLFDGMESFQTDETLEMSFLDSLEQAPKMLSADDWEDALKLADK